MAMPLVPASSRAQSTDANSASPPFEISPKAVLVDVKDYVTAPFHWQSRQWQYFGETLIAIGAAHHFDDQIRNHFVANKNTPLDGKDRYSTKDAIPAAAVVAGTWFYATMIDEDRGRHEAWSMLEAAGLSSATGFALKYAAGRLRPNETTDPNAWRKRGDSFPSLHVTAAFAIGTVLAESGSDDYRWVRRFLGYGIATATAYQRMKHNVHWLSDTVAASALGIASARFIVNRTKEADRDQAASVMLVPVDRGFMLTYSIPLR